jgi:anti-sigma factor RsiW
MMTMMTAGLSCREVTEKANAFVDGHMSTAQWLQFRMHVMMCGHCREYLHQVEMTIDALRDLPGPESTEMKSELVRRFKQWAAERADEA